MDAEINIRMVGPGQSDLALEYVRSVYQRKFGTQPKTLWRDCLVAEDSHGIVGVMAMQFSEGERFEVESHFLFDFAALVHPRKKFVSFGRWVATKLGAGNALMFAGVQYALSRERSFSLSCSKTETLKALRRRYGLRYDILRFPVNAMVIPAEDHNFFLSPPAPCLCAASLQQWYDRLALAMQPEVKIHL
jgi:hypothetical protein